MQVIRSPADAANIADPAIRQMIQQWIDAIASDEPYDANLHGYFVVLEDGDTLGAIAAEIGFDPPAKTPEILEEYPDCYDLLFIISDDGYGIESFIPKTLDCFHRYGFDQWRQNSVITPRSIKTQCSSGLPNCCPWSVKIGRGGQIGIGGNNEEQAADIDVGFGGGISASWLTTMCLLELVAIATQFEQPYWQR